MTSLVRHVITYLRGGEIHHLERGGTPGCQVVMGGEQVYFDGACPKHLQVLRGLPIPLSSRCKHIVVALKGLRAGPRLAGEVQSGLGLGGQHRVVCPSHTARP